MKDNLSLVGSEIINSNNNLNTISPLTPGKSQEKLIIKSYNIINTPKNNNKYIEKKYTETKRGNSLDLSKIMYNDGVILTDAVNSNPGFGLWAIKGSSHNETDRTINTITNNRTKTSRTLSNNKLLIKQNNNDSINNRYNLTKRTNKQTINNISTINNINNINNTSISKNSITNNNIKSLNISNETKNKNNEKKKSNKKIIDLLTMKCNDLEQKCVNIMSNYTQKENLCKNTIKMKNEFEKMLKENLEETKSLKEEYQKLSQDNTKLKNVFKNTKNEVDRLMNVMRTDKNTINNIREEFENRLRNEEIERARLNNILNINEKEIEALRKSVYGEGENPNGNINNNNNNTPKKRNSINIGNINIIDNKNSSKKKDFEIDNLNNIILELEIKISNLKKKIVKTDEENDKLRNVLRFKEQKDEIEKNNLTNLFNLLQHTTKNRQNELNTINEQNYIITNLKNNNDFKKKKNHLFKSMSLKKVKFKNKIENL